MLFMMFFQGGFAGLDKEMNKQYLLEDAGEVMHACLYFAQEGLGDKPGAFPRDLNELAENDLIDPYYLDWHHPETQVQSPWILTPGLTSESPPDKILFRSPESVDGLELVAVVDGRVYYQDENGVLG